MLNIFKHYQPTPEASTDFFDLAPSDSIIIGILYIGEPQLDSLLDSIESYSDYSHIPVFVHIFIGMSNIDAHRSLYNLFSSQPYVLRIKIDADCVIKDIDLFAASVYEFRCRVAHSVCLTFDHISRSMIYGISFFSPNLVLSSSSDSTFVDQHLGTSPVLESYAGIDHAVNPTKIQILSYIAHRIGKFKSSSLLSQKYSYFKLCIRSYLFHFFHLSPSHHIKILGFLFRDPLVFYNNRHRNSHHSLDRVSSTSRI